MFLINGIYVLYVLDLPLFYYGNQNTIYRKGTISPTPQPMSPGRPQAQTTSRALEEIVSAPLMTPDLCGCVFLGGTLGCRWETLDTILLFVV